jgi:hypothetical protein
MAAIAGGMRWARPALWEERALRDPGEASGHSVETGLRIENWFGPHVPGVSLPRPGAAGHRCGDWLRAAPRGQAQLAARVCVVQVGTGVRLCHSDRCRVRRAVPHTATATCRLAAAVAGLAMGASEEKALRKTHQAIHRRPLLVERSGLGRRKDDVEPAERSRDGLRSRSWDRSRLIPLASEPSPDRRRDGDRSLERSRERRSDVRWVPQPSFWRGEPRPWPLPPQPSEDGSRERARRGSRRSSLRPRYDRSRYGERSRERPRGTCWSVRRAPLGRFGSGGASFRACHLVR